MNETVLTVVGHVASDPSLRVTASGLSVANFRLASTERRYDKAAGAWRDHDTIFWTVCCWRQAAENVAASLSKGQPVVVHGRLRERGYEVDGQRRTCLEIDAVTVGHDLTRGVASFRRCAPPRPDGPAAPTTPTTPTTAATPTAQVRALPSSPAAAEGSAA